MGIGLQEEASSHECYERCRGYGQECIRIAVADDNWKVIETRRLTRTRSERRFAKRAVTLVIMDACGSAHHLVRWRPAAASDMAPVRVKSVEQHALQGLHRIRLVWMATRASSINTLRGRVGCVGGSS